MAKGIASRTEFDPADYEVIGHFYLGDDEEIQYEYTYDHQALSALGHDELILNAGHCDSCGTGYLHGAVVEGPEGFLAVGGICAGEYFGVPSIASFKRAQAQKARERKARKAAGEAFLVAHGLEEVAAHDFTGNPVDHPKDGTYFEGWGGGVVHDILQKLYRYGDLSPKQVALLKKIHEEHHERIAEREEEKAASVDIPEARVGVRTSIEATLLGTKYQESYYSPYPTLKGLFQVEANGGVFKLWGTVPSAIISKYDADGNYLGEISKGDRVAFDAKIEVSGDDPTFGFFSRPTKAKFVG